MEGERHLLSNHTDIEARPINNAIEHFLYAESFLASHAGVFRGARFSSLLVRDEKRAPLKTPAWEAKSFREEQKICLNLVRAEARTLSRFFQRALGDFHFLLFPRITNVIKGNVGESISTIIIVAPLVAIMKPSSSDLE